MSDEYETNDDGTQGSRILGEIENKEPSPETEIREFTFVDAYEGNSTVKIWCEGRERDPSTESYHPVYAYSIISPKFQYDDNDLRGGANESPNLDKGAQSLMSYLYACQEGMPSRRGENADIFPPEVRSWAYHFSEEIGTISIQLQDN